MPQFLPVCLSVQHGVSCAVLKSSDANREEYTSAFSAESYNDL